MRIYFILTALLCIVCLSFPLLTCSICKKNENTTADKETVTTALTEESNSDKETISVFNTSYGKTTETDMTEYIIGVVAGEMPASFCDEALKAQSVAAYTYAKYIRENGNSTITDSSSLHQSYIDKKAQKSKWGKDYDLYRNRIESAVNSVKGEYLAYNGKTALTVFHAESDNKTNSAEEIWNSTVPYLISVDAPSAEEFNAEYTFTPEEFKSLFEEKGKLKITEKDIKKWASITKKNENGYIRKLKVADTEFSSVEVKDILSLSSADFTGRIENDTFIFTAKGKGHGVGMSQYSAEHMAQNGKSYKEILSHFYPGTTLKKE